MHTEKFNYFFIKLENLKWGNRAIVSKYKHKRIFASELNINSFWKAIAFIKTTCTDFFIHFQNFDTVMCK